MICKTRTVGQNGSTNKSLFITLPKEWTEKYGVEAKDTVIVQEMSDGALRVEKVKA
jgi:bifunctional DNA-binding transcriptional regulator/antitoxin component of YhaV-PrlF toxin-antitoxin module